MWVRDYRVDGLRLDADARDLRRVPRARAGRARRARARRSQPDALVISEMEPGDRRPIEEWGHDAQWADELHHALHVLLTGERDGYYAGFGTVDDLARALRATGAGAARRLRAEPRPGRQPRVRRPPAAGRAPRSPRPCLLFAPQTPLLFMGEEYGETRPFQFFTDHDDPAIADATREGRRKEFATFAAFARRGRARPAGAGDLRALEARPERGRRRAARVLPRAARAAPHAAARGRDATWTSGAASLRVRRGDVELVADFAAQDGGAAPDDGRSGPASRSRSARSGTGDGTNFSLFSENAERVELCLFDDDDSETRIELTERTAFNWHCYLPGVGPGPALRLPRPRPVRARARACASTRRSC